MRVAPGGAKIRLRRKCILARQELQ